jgi:hypothetical protein
MIESDLIIGYVTESEKILDVRKPALRQQRPEKGELDVAGRLENGSLVIK